MSGWSPQDWTMLLTAAGTLVTAVFAAMAAFLANLAKLRSETNAKKIDNNTVLTQRGTDVASENARIAAVAATEAKVTAKEVSINLAKTLNGEMDSRIHSIVKECTAPLVSDIREIKQSLNELKHQTKR